VDAVRGEAGYDLVAFGYLGLDEESEIGEGGVIRDDRSLETLLAGKQTSIDKVRGEQLVYGVQVAPSVRLE